MPPALAQFGAHRVSLALNLAKFRAHRVSFTLKLASRRSLLYCGREVLQKVLEPGICTAANSVAIELYVPRCLCLALRCSCAL